MNTFTKHLFSISIGIIASFTLIAPVTLSHTPVQASETIQAGDTLIAASNPFLEDEGSFDRLGLKGKGLAGGAGENESPQAYVKKLISTVTNWILGIIATLAVLFMVIAGGIWITAAGNDTRIGQAKKILSYAVGGLLIAFFSYAIVTAIVTLIFQEETRQEETGPKSAGERSGEESSSEEDGRDGEESSSEGGSDGEEASSEGGSDGEEASSEEGSDGEG